jgi:putative addiction module component (TIGR02574 family)
LVPDEVYFIAMSTITEEIISIERVTEMALGLSKGDRAQLLEALEYSLLTESERADRDVWIKELERRVTEVESGDVETINGEQVMAEAYEMLRNLHPAR